MSRALALTVCAGVETGTTKARVMATARLRLFIFMVSRILYDAERMLVERRASSPVAPSNRLFCFYRRECVLDAIFQRLVGVNGRLRISDGLEPGFDFPVERESSIACGVRVVGRDI